MSQTIKDILDEFRLAAENNRDLGDKFERLIAGYLTKDPYFADHYSDVWLWTEWPGRGKKPDTGIDLVAKERATGDFCAIQCKFLHPDHQLQKADIDSFFTASGKEPFKRRLIVSTTDKWSKHAEDALANQQIPVSRLRVQDLDESPIDWSDFKLARPADIKLKPKKKLRPHQEVALGKVKEGLKKADRGKLIMACGTGKTFTALKIAETIVPDGGNVLYLVPSISLISQTLTEWATEAKRPLSCFAVCSDSKVGKKNASEDITTHDLAFPADTDPRKLVKQIRGIKTIKKNGITVIFSTYQSITVVAEAQKLGVPEFDLIICDEAHRTTGIEDNPKEASEFVKVHDANFIRGKKRLYMTATPRIYDDASKGKAKDADITLYSMDNPDHYGEELHRLGFGEAVSNGLLSDYKVMVLAVDEKFVSGKFQSQLADKNNELRLEDVVKIVGCWNGLRKRTVKSEGDGAEAIDPTPMRRAVAFSRSIADSKKLRDLFAGIIKDYQRPVDTNGDAVANDDFLQCQVDHVDGTYNSLQRNERLQWLKADTSHDGNICRILSNARCLSEGVDVPALDAVMFLNPRNSVVDVVQSVGRVMRKSEGKQYGYIILPIGIPADMKPEEALADNEKYKVVWQVLQALRAHDDRFNAIVNKIDINKEHTDKIQIIGVGGWDDVSGEPTEIQTALNFPLEDWEDAIFARIVVKCGSRRYWESWAQDVARIAEHHVTRIKALLKRSDAPYRKQFDKFLSGLRKTLNPSISEDDAVEMLSQHLITKPVFDALFEGYEFTKQNPVSKTMQKMLDLLEEQSLEKETKTLESFYESVRERANGIDNAEGKQRIVIELYDKFFKTAFPRMAERLGIVYTPVEVVDFILHSVNDALKSEFGVGLTDKNVHILDPFTGTATFIVRLLQSGIIEDKDLVRKYREELHANEIVLLAYYIAAINIEEAFHGRAKADYEPFEGIVLTDTFQLSEGKGTFDDPTFQVNSGRAAKQNKLEIRVVLGNPPYSVGQDSVNDDNQNLKYPQLDSRIRDTYAAQTAYTNKRAIYDSYVRAFRWASDRIKDQGVVCFVSNASLIDSNAMDGLRKCLMDEFTSIYCFNLRGNQRTSGETSRQEGGKIFGSGSRAQIAITLLVKNRESNGKCKLFYYDIGDYLTREDKLSIIAKYASVADVPWSKITPNKRNDWINQRDPAFETFIAIGDKETKGNADSSTVFISYSRGVGTNRDAWAFNYSRQELAANMRRMIEFYNLQTNEFQALCRSKSVPVDTFIDNDPKKIKWSDDIKRDLSKFTVHAYLPESERLGMYRPFCKQWVYFNKTFNWSRYLTHKFFPDPETFNVVICISGVGNRIGFSALITNMIPDMHMADSNGASQNFPLYLYNISDSNGGLFDVGRQDKHERQDNISESLLNQFRNAYGANLGKEDIFYYVYGILHSPEYKSRFDADLKKMLPRIPLAKEFWAFSKAGRKLADIHLNYETAKPYPVKERCDQLDLNPDKLYLVEKMRFGKNDKGVDKTTIQYNSHITLTGIPLEAYEYVVNGKPAIEWIIDRYQFSKDKDSQIVNDPNDWAREHGDPKYIPNLLKRIITVSLETMKIVKALPPLNEKK